MTNWNIEKRMRCWVTEHPDNDRTLGRQELRNILEIIDDLRAENEQLKKELDRKDNELDELRDALVCAPFGLE